MVFLATAFPEEGLSSSSSDEMEINRGAGRASLHIVWRISERSWVKRLKEGLSGSSLQPIFCLELAVNSLNSIEELKTYLYDLNMITN